jgi:hypothetical protein
MKKLLSCFVFFSLVIALSYSQSVPLKEGFRVWYEFGMYIGFDTDDTPPDIEFPEVISINDRNNFLRDHVLRENTLYAFLLNEFSDFDWDDEFNDWYNYTENYGVAAEIFSKAIDIYVELQTISNENEERDSIVGNSIAMIHYYRESPHLVGIIKPANSLNTNFNGPLTIDASQALFGRPHYYIVENTTHKGNVITVYNFAKCNLFMIFDKGILQGICIIN